MHWKTSLFVVVLFIAGPIPSARAASFDIAFIGAYRTAKSSRIRDVYGNGFVVIPILGVRLGRGLSVAAGAELGYEREGEIGLYLEKTDLSVRGGTLFATWEPARGRISPYLKAGIARLSYEQTIESAVPLGRIVKGRKTSPMFGAGARIEFGARLFALAEVHYIPLKVKPYEIEVDLGGWRFGLGVGVTFSL